MRRTAAESREGVSNNRVAALADAVVGVTFFGQQSPEDFDTFCRAFVSMFRITIGRREDVGGRREWFGGVGGCGVPCQVRASEGEMRVGNTERGAKGGEER